MGRNESLGVIRGAMSDRLSRLLTFLFGQAPPHLFSLNSNLLLLTVLCTVLSPQSGLASRNDHFSCFLSSPSDVWAGWRDRLWSLAIVWHEAIAGDWLLFNDVTWLLEERIMHQRQAVHAVS
jgi:hypothetical protein